MPSFQKMICLVGENPLPIYLGIKQFVERKSADTKVILVHSSETKEEAEAVRTTCETHIGLRRNQFVLELLLKPFEPNLVQKKMGELRNIYPDAALNYTGGTKVMSGFGLVAWSSRVDNESLLGRAFYLEEGTGNFHFGDRAEGVPLSVVLSLDELRALHGVDAPRADNALDLGSQDLRQVFEKQPKDRTFFSGGAPRYKDLDSQDQKDWNTFLEMLTPETRRKWAAHFAQDWKRQYECAAGKWFEQLVWRLICSLRAGGPSLSFDDNFNDAQHAPPLIAEDEIFYNQYFPVAKEHFGFRLQFESDLLLVYNQRLRYFSVTTSRSEKTCKAKMFEAKYRSQQIGGGMANSCVVCLADGEVKSKDGYECDIVTALGLALGSDSRHIFFGWADVREWMEGNTESLRQFLTE